MAGSEVDASSAVTVTNDEWINLPLTRNASYDATNAYQVSQLDGLLTEREEEIRSLRAELGEQEGRLAALRARVEEREGEMKGLRERAEAAEAATQGLRCVILRLCMCVYLCAYESWVMGLILCPWTYVYTHTHSLIHPQARAGGGRGGGALAGGAAACQGAGAAGGGGGALGGGPGPGGAGKGGRIGGVLMVMVMDAFDRLTHYTMDASPSPHPTSRRP